LTSYSFPKKCSESLLSAPRNVPEVQEQFLEGADTEPEEPVKEERTILKHEVEADLISDPPFVVYKLFRATKKQGRTIKVEVGQFKGKFRILDPSSKEKVEPAMNLVEMFKPVDYMVRVYVLECFQLVPKDADGGKFSCFQDSDSISCSQSKLISFSN
jgi:hypothetical protein